nr:DUF5979 domain-containing protein [Corynebacterium ulcerans]
MSAARKQARENINGALSATDLLTTDIPINTNCTITESEVDVPAGVTWLGTLPSGGKFTIKEGETVDIHAKNTFEHSDLSPRRINRRCTPCSQHCARSLCCSRSCSS